MLFLYSKTGLIAYAKAMTLMTTCEMLNINKYQYIQWAFDCGKKEMHETMFLKQNRGNAKNNCYFPNIQKDENGIVIDLFDKKYDCPFDLVKWERYTPYKYKEQLVAECNVVRQNKNKSEPLNSS